MIEVLTMTPLAILQLYMWYRAFQTHTSFAFFLLGWYMHKHYVTYHAYWETKPWIGCKIWAAVLDDWRHIPRDIWCWCTISQDGWVTRDDQIQRVAVEDKKKR